MGIAYPILVVRSVYFTNNRPSLSLFKGLSNADIRLFRFDDKTGQVYILAGDEVQIIVYPNGESEFVNEPEL